MRTTCWIGGLGAAALAVVPAGPAAAQETMAAPAPAPSPAPMPTARDFKLEPKPASPPTPPPERQGPEIGAAPPAAATPAPVSVAPPRLPPVARPAAPARATPATGSAARGPAAPAPSSPAPTLPPATAAPSTAPANPTPASPVAQAKPAPARPTGTPPAAELLPPWAPLVSALAVLLAALAGILGYRRWVRRQQEADGASEPAAAPEPALPPVTTAPAPAPPLPRPRLVQAESGVPHLELSLTADHARATLMGVTIGYRLDIANLGDGTARDVVADVHLTHASPDIERHLNLLLAADLPEPTHEAGTIAPGHTVTLTGEIRLAHDAIGIVEFAGQRLMIPVLGVVVRQSGTARGGRTTATYVVGIERDPPQPRMGAFRLDQGPREFAPLGVRPTGVTLLA